MAFFSQKSLGVSLCEQPGSGERIILNTSGNSNMWVDEEQYHTWREVLLHMGLVFFLVQFVFDIVALELLWTRT